MNEAEKIERQKAMYGNELTQELIDQQVVEFLEDGYTIDKLIVSMLSDVQEQILRNLKEEARQTINIVKYISNAHIGKK